jgi:iron complex transport system ATP-binding protein
MLKVQNLLLQRNGRDLISRVSFKLHAGEFTVILGANGAGKSTLLKLISGRLTPTQGDVLLDDAPIAAFTAMALSKKRSFLAQSRQVAFDFTAHEVVLMGRAPHCPGGESPADHTIASQALEQASCGGLSQRIYSSLSGGEASRVDLARILAQDAPLVLLDEPTNHLDVRHQLETLQLCTNLAMEGCCVLAALHDLNLAARYADRLLLLHQGVLVADGVPDHVLTPEILDPVYGVSFDVIRRAGHPPVITATATPVEDTAQVNPNKISKTSERIFA